MAARVGGALSGMGAALAPALALADNGTFQAAERTLETPGDLTTVVWVTLLFLATLFIVVTVGYAYRQKRHLDWVFQRPDAPHDDQH